MSERLLCGRGPVIPAPVRVCDLAEGAIEGGEWDMIACLVEQRERGSDEGLHFVGRRLTDSVPVVGTERLCNRSVRFFPCFGCLRGCTCSDGGRTIRILL